MKYDDRIIELLKELEGKKLKAYKDSNGVLTIGYGHTDATGTFDFDKGTEITEEEAEEILRKDLDAANKIVLQMMENADIELNQQQFDYAVAVYFHRPWALRDGGLQQIATGNIDLVNMDQQEKIQKRADEEEYEARPILNRLQKEVEYVNEFDDPYEDGGNITPESGGYITLYRGDNGEATQVEASVADIIVKNTHYTYEAPVENVGVGGPALNYYKMLQELTRRHQ
tara:strand:- start:663 stop:1346 length:684 start_codon:yes stop_codon:yes gene_type:complete